MAAKRLGHRCAVCERNRITGAGAMRAGVTAGPGDVRGTGGEIAQDRESAKEGRECAAGRKCRSGDFPGGRTGEEEWGRDVPGGRASVRPGLFMGGALV